MSIDNRPVLARYSELVFTDNPWSPTVGQTVALIKLRMGEELPKALRSSIVQTANSPGSRGAKVEEAGFVTTQVAIFNILHTPDCQFLSTSLELRKAVLGLAVAKISYQMLEEAKA